MSARSDLRREREQNRTRGSEQRRLFATTNRRRVQIRCTAGLPDTDRSGWVQLKLGILNLGNFDLICIFSGFQPFRVRRPQNKQIKLVDHLNIKLNLWN